MSPAPSSQAVLESCPDALLVVGEDGTIRMVNAATERMLGYSRDELVGQDHRMLVAEGFRSGFRRLLSILQGDAEGGSVPPVEVYGRHRDGSEFQAEITCSLVSPAWHSADARRATDVDSSPGWRSTNPGWRSTNAGRAADAGPGRNPTPPATPDDVWVAVLVRDTSRRMQSDTELRGAMSLLTATLESTADGILVVSREGEIAGVNNRFTSMWGVPQDLLATRDADAVLGFVVDQLVDPVGFTERVRALQADPAEESHDVVDFRDGRTFERYSRPQLVADEVVGRVWSFRDVSPARVAQDQITQAMADLAEQAAQLKALAFKDPLTGLSNRQLFNERLAAALRGPSGTPVDVLLLDLDDFKEVNDIHGHHAGDQMLVEVGRRLLACVRPDDVVARLGGDEFVILLVGSADPGAAAERIVESLKVPLWIDGTMLRPSLSLGLASICEEVVDASELLRRADVAMYAAKAAGKNRYLRFRPEMMMALVERTEMEAGLRMAVDSGQIGVHYQPILSAVHGTVLKIEALARWERDGELVPPQQFIPVAERSGLIMEIGTEVLFRACMEMKSWLAEDASRSLAVNVSGVQLQHGDFAELVLAVTESCGVNPRQLVLEVTESVFFHDDCHVIQQLAALRKAGARVALDDFGTGYSSLGRLQDLPVDTLKIDQSFVSMIHTGTEKLPILSSMISMAHGLGLTVTAEGVETEKQARYLLQLECDSLQGFIFSRPEPRPLLEPAISRSIAAFTALRGDRVSGNR